MRLLFFAALLLPVVATAQPEVGFDVGIVRPVADLGENRTAGVSAALSAGFGTASRPWGTRVEVGVQHLFGPAAPPYGGTSAQFDDLTVANARASVVRTARVGQGWGVYGLAGVGAYGLFSVNSGTFGGGPGLHAGIGARIPAGRSSLTVETQGIVIASEFATGDFTPALYVPLTVGVRL